MTYSRLEVVSNRDRIVQTAAWIIGVFMTNLFAMSAYGVDVDVSVLDRDGRQVADVVVYAARLDGNIASPNPAKNAVMDQVDMQFVPHVLVVQTGTAVDFPNSDSVAHHVYSFSHPNKFVLPMYKGKQHPPVSFEHSGIVSLGCNIHDHMLGYIVIVDTDVFSTTDDSGRVSLTVDDDATQYTVHIWSPRLREAEDSLSKTLHISDHEDARLTFTLQKSLRAPHQSLSDGVKWSEY